MKMKSLNFKIFKKINDKIAILNFFENISLNSIFSKTKVLLKYEHFKILKNKI